MTVADLVDVGIGGRNIEPSARRDNIRTLTVYLQGALRFHRRLIKRRIVPHKYLRILNLPFASTFVTLTYLFTKLMYLVNAFLQFHLLNR
jgi:hypothetical protein